MTEHPSDAELRTASTALMAARFQEDLDDLEARLAATWRGRLALRLARWTVALQQLAHHTAGGIRYLIAEIDAGITHARWP